MSGAHTQTLDLVPSERSRFESLGWAILITSCMAALSMWFALSSAMGLNGIVAIPAALLWGLVIMGIDRWLVTSMPADSTRKWLMALPRFLLALLLGTLISTPFVLRIFEPEINAQIAVMQQNGYNNFLKQQQASDVAKQVSTYKAELAQLNAVILSHGASTGNTASDPQLVSYNSQLVQLQAQETKWIGLKNTYYTNFTCQKYGGAQCPKKGVGPAAEASYNSYLQAAQQVTTIQGEVTKVRDNIAARDKQLNSNSVADQQARYQQAVAAKPQVQNSYNTALQRQDQFQAVYYTQEQANHGLLIRLEALSQLSNGNPTVTSARFLLFLLFLVIECLPVTVKLLQRPGLYEDALLYAESAERTHVARYYRNWTGPMPIGSGAPAVVPGHVERDVQNAVLDLWAPPPTRALPGQFGYRDDAAGGDTLGYQNGNGSRPASYPPPGREPERFSQFPPTEGESRPSGGWGRSAAFSQHRDDPQPRDPQPSEPPGRHAAPDDPWSGPTRTDLAQPGPPARGNGYEPDYGPLAVNGYTDPGNGYPDVPQTEHDALARMDDELRPARPEGTGIALNWDDDE